MDLKLTTMKNVILNTETGIFTSKLNGFSREGLTSMPMVLLADKMNKLIDRYEKSLQTKIFVSSSTGTVELF